MNGENITYLYDANDSRMYKQVDTTLEEYYLKDLGVLDMKTGNWSYYLSGTERFMRIAPDSVHQPQYNAGIDSISISNGERFYYETDHLGNTRIVFSPRDVYFKYIHFASDFYPYGKILREYVVGNQERYLTTQHERDQETGLDYRGARYYDASVGKFLGIDPLAHKFPAWSTYSFCFDNPLKFVDPDGRAPEYIDVTKNKDGTYTVVGGVANSDKNIYVVDANGKRTGEIVGQMLTEYSFHDNNGNAVKGAIINPADMSGANFLNNEIMNNSNGLGLIEYMKNGTGREKYDFKTIGIEDRPEGMSSSQYTYRGMLFNSKLASARDIGNYGAGYVAGRRAIPWVLARAAFDALETNQQSGWKMWDWKTEGQPTQQAQFMGYNEGIKNYLEAVRKIQWANAQRTVPFGPK